MDWLNYHHLLYFWVVAREGSISRACEQLQLAQPTISSQIQKLEKSLGEKLFDRVGRNLRLTDTGQLVFRYADEIFSLGRELTDAIKGRPTGRPLRLTVGAPEIIPKLIVHRLLQPALELDEPGAALVRLPTDAVAQRDEPAVAVAGLVRLEVAAQAWVVRLPAQRPAVVTQTRPGIPLPSPGSSGGRGFLRLPSIVPPAEM